MAIEKPDPTVVCKPTPWFLLRALAMLLMFGVFAVMFYIDGSKGYRKKNEAFYIHKTFQMANDGFSKMNADGTLTPEIWKAFAEKQSVAFPADPGLLPADLKQPMPWPPILHDFERMKPLQWNLLWTEYAGQREMDDEVKEKPFDSREIAEQWVVFHFCSALALAAAIILIRTSRRSISADPDGIVSQQGKKIPYADLKRLDLRKWDTKGLAFADYEGASGKGRIRIDGLTYGGFKKEQGEPAESLMRLIRSRFSGEIIEYATVSGEETGDDGAKPA